MSRWPPPLAMSSTRSGPGACIQGGGPYRRPDGRGRAADRIGAAERVEGVDVAPDVEVRLVHHLGLEHAGARQAMSFQPLTILATRSEHVLHHAARFGL